MELANYAHPLRSIIRCKARMQLLQEVDPAEAPLPVDEKLLKDLAAAVFNSSQYQTFYKTCRSQPEADEMEDKLAAELAQTYQEVLKQQQQPLVQRLNALL